MNSCLAVITWGVESRPVWIAVITLALTSVLATIWIYRNQGPAIPRFWRGLMASLRAVALSVICFSILQPTAVRPLRGDEAGGVAILIDRSSSMAAIDSGDAPPERVASADALHLFPANVRPNELAALRQRLERIVPVLDEIRRASAERQYAMLMDQSAQIQQQHLDELAERLRTECRAIAQEPMAVSLGDLTEGIDSPQWAEQAQKKIDAVLANLIGAQRASDENLYRENPAVQKACETLASMNRLERARLAAKQVVEQIPSSVPIYGGFFSSGLTPASLRKDGAMVWPADIYPSGDQSDISGALRELFSRTIDQRLQAVLLLTDGRQVGGSIGPLPQTTPIFLILCAGRPIDLAMGKISSPTDVYLDEPISVDAQMRAVNLADIAVKVALRNQNLTQVQSLDLDHAGNANAHFSVPMPRAGDQTIRLDIAPLPGEAMVQNNSAEFHIHVSTQRLKIALLSSYPTRDFQFLRADLQRTAWIDSRIVLPGDQISPAEILQQQVIVLDDLAPRQLSSDQWDAIHQFTKHGGGLVFIAGGNHLPSEYLGDPHLTDLLPFSGSDEPAWRTWAGEDAYFRFASADTDLPMLNLAQDGRDILRQWADLPGMYHYLRMPVLKDGVQPLLIERESGSPVLTENRMGSGRIFLVGFNETWRWRSVGPAIQHRFWLQLLRHAAPVSDALHVQLPAPELADLEPDPLFLTRLAGGNGGSVLPLSDIGQVWKKIEQHQQAHPSVTEDPLWHSPWLFALIVGCLGAEWGLRKRFGLA